MPSVPNLPPEMLQQTGGQMPTSPANFLMATAEAHSRGDFQSMPVPKGKDFQTGKPAPRRKHMQVVK